MKFRLTYEGPLQATQREAVGEQKDRLAIHKHNIRKQFHGQLKQLWATNRFLRNTQVSPTQYIAPRADTSKFPQVDQVPLSQALVLSGAHSVFGFNFLPLVWERFNLVCSLDILFLRRDIPGSALDAGDIDNRIKTLIDALRPPKHQHEVRAPDGASIAPGTGEDPFYCLLEDDKQVSHFAIETDTLLDPLDENDTDKRSVRLVVTVELKPYNVSMFNLSYL